LALGLIAGLVGGIFTMGALPGAAGADQSTPVSLGDECASARALLDSGEASEAQKAYIEVLKAQPSSECAAEGLKEASDPTLWDDLKTVSEDAVTALGVFVLAIGAFVAIVLVLVNLLARLPWFKSHWPISRIRRPTVSVESFGDTGLKDQKLGVGVAALVRERVEAGSVGSALKVVSGTATTEETWIDRVSEIGEQGKIAAAAIGLLVSLLPRQNVKVSGELQPSAEPAGAGASVELYRKLQSTGSTSFWAAQFQLPIGEGVGTAQRLAVPVAAWVSHMVTTQTEGTAMGSSDSTSWAFFKAGVERQGEGDVDAAQKLYLEALTHDPWNYGALRNLAGLEAASGMHAMAIKRLMKALKSVEDQ
jgi:tetratricopeptide (TPR) repeat protein